MPASEAMIGYGTTIEVENDASPAVFTKLGEVTSVTPPSSTVDDIDVTHLESPGRTREYIPGLKDFSEIPIELNWVVGGTTDDFILDWEASGERRNVRITYPNNATDTFLAYARGYSGSAVTVDGKLAATLTLKVAGEHTRGTAT